MAGRRRQGQSLGEYSLALALVAVVAIVALVGVSAGSGDLFSTIASQIAGLAGDSAPVVAPSPPPVDQSGNYSGNGIWHTLASAATATAAGAPLELTYDAWVSSDCSGWHKVFSYQLLDSADTVLVSGRAETTADTSSGHTLEFTATPLRIDAAVSRDTYRFQVSVSSPCDWQSSPAAALSATAISANAGPPAVPDLSGSYTGGGVWHTVAVTATTQARAATVSGSFSGQTSSNCQGQDKVFQWRLTDSLGFVLTSGQAQVGADSTSAHDLAFAGTFAQTTPLANEWYALELRVGSSCLFQTSSLVITTSAAVSQDAGAAPSVDRSGTYSGAWVWHPLALVTTTRPAGDAISGSYDAWVGSNCVGQGKQFDWRVVGARGFIWSTGSQGDGADSSSGHDLHISGTIAQTSLFANEWYVLEMRVESSCDFSTVPLPSISIP